MDQQTQASRPVASDGALGAPRVLARIPDLNSPMNAALWPPRTADTAAASSTTPPADNPLASLAAPVAKSIEQIGQGAKWNPREFVARAVSSCRTKAAQWRDHPRKKSLAVVAAVVVLGVFLATRDRSAHQPAVDTATPVVAPDSAPVVAKTEPAASPTTQVEVVSTATTSAVPRLARIPGPPTDHSRAAPPIMPEKFPATTLPSVQPADIHPAEAQPAEVSSPTEREVPPVARLRGVIVK